MKILYLWLVVFLFAGQMTACRNDVHLFENDVLISSGETVITVGEYQKALEVTKTGYPEKLIRNKDAFKALQIRLLSQMIEELIIEKVAEEKHIRIPENEFRAAVDEIKKDYPEGVFEEMLLENAITNKLWEDRLRKRLLMEKVLDAEFDSKINISTSDMTSYYEQHADTIESEFEDSEDEQKVYDRILKRMKLEKKQGAYQEWIDRKKADYSIEVNQKIWEKILGS
jgi:hypothetical protein